MKRRNPGSGPVFNDVEDEQITHLYHTLRKSVGVLRKIEDADVIQPKRAQEYHHNYDRAIDALDKLNSVMSDLGGELEMHRQRIESSIDRFNKTEGW